MSVTMQQIADLAGVSRGTVDRALNNRGRIRPEMAEKLRNNWATSRTWRQKSLTFGNKSCHKTFNF